MTVNPEKRIVGSVTTERLTILRQSDEILTEEIRSSGWDSKIAQAFCVLLPVSTVGVMGDNRSYEGQELIVVRCSDDSGCWVHINHATLGRIANRIINEIVGVNRVVYDVTSKPQKVA